MKRITCKHRRSGGWIGIAAALCALAAPALRAAPADKTASVSPQRLNYKITKLKNGLKVVTLEDHRAPVVTLQIWYHVGSKDEAPGKAGFAHLFEHLMFKGSDHVGPQEHTKYIEQLGGDYNANTSFDRTLFFETVPSNALERILFMEADRMASLKVDEANLKSERDVVKEEHRQGVENRAYGTLLENVQALVFPPAHPYAHTTIGIMSDLDSAKIEDVRAFHDEYYKPDNATLILVGDFKTADGLALIRKYFEAIPHSTKPFTRYPVVASDQKAPKQMVYYDKLAPLPLVGMAYRIPGANNPDTPALEILQQILSAGQSSRMYRSLVRDKQLAVQAGGSALDLRLAGIFFFFALPNAGKAPADVEKALQEQVDLLQNQPVSAAELEKAKNQVLSEKVLGTVSTEAKASQLGEADLLYDTPEEANRELTELNKVTAADIQRVAKKYFAANDRNLFEMLPAAMQPKTGTPTKGAK